MEVSTRQYYEWLKALEMIVQKQNKVALDKSKPFWNMVEHEN